MVSCRALQNIGYLTPFQPLAPISSAFWHKGVDSKMIVPRLRDARKLIATVFFFK
jgi:hypothetical protein